jgi:hypothetical protein
MRNPIVTLISIAALCVATPAAAQFGGLGGSGNGGGGLPGLAGALGGGGLVPNLGSQSVGNAAGILGYCLQNKLLGGQTAGNAQSVLGSLTGQGKVQDQSKAYQAGQNGQLLAGNSALSLDSLKGQVKGKICDMVLQRAKGFL